MATSIMSRTCAKDLQDGVDYIFLESARFMATSTALHAESDAEKRLIEAAAMALPTVLPPGSDTLALAALSHVYSPAAVGGMLDAAANYLGDSILEFPATERASRVLLENR